MKICGLRVWEATFIKVNQLRYDFLSQKYQGTSVEVLIALNGIFFLLISFSLSPTCRVSLETHTQSMIVAHQF